MKRWSDLEVDLLIEDLSEAAIEAIERAAAEAAKAAALAAVEREAAAMREATKWRTEAYAYLDEIAGMNRAHFKNAVITGVICLLSGMAVGVCGSLMMRGR